LRGIVVVRRLEFVNLASSVLGKGIVAAALVAGSVSRVTVVNL
jgi:hypothetical protein